MKEHRDVEIIVELKDGEGRASGDARVVELLESKGFIVSRGIDNIIAYVK